jgi:hypothetical protein
LLIGVIDSTTCADETVSTDRDWRIEKCLSLAYRDWFFWRLPPSLSSKSLADGQQPNQLRFRGPDRQFSPGTLSAPTVGRLSKMAGNFAAAVVRGEASESRRDGFISQFFRNLVSSGIRRGQL